MTRTMYDSTWAPDIPHDAQIVAGYVNGLYTWSMAHWNLFPDALKVRIGVYIPGKPIPLDCDVLDVEASDAGHPQARNAAAQWVGDKIARQEHPVIYTSFDSLQNFAGLFCSFWAAHYTSEPHMVSKPGFDIVATQYAAPDYGSGGHFDISLTTDNWPGGESPLMHKLFKFLPTKSGNGYWIVDTDANVYAYGDAENKFFGHPDPGELAGNLTEFIMLPEEDGYWFVTDTCNVYAYGAAEMYGHP